MTMTCYSLTLIAAGLLVIGHVYGQSSQQEWSAEELFNPQNDPTECGFSSDYPAYICDPNFVFGSNLNALNWILTDAAHNGTKCPCSNYHCEHAKKEVLGYKIFVAVVKRMKKTVSDDGKVMTRAQQADHFASHLGTTKWKIGSCEENIVIFYSVDDKKLSIYTGVTGARKLTKEYKDLLAFKIRPRLSDRRFDEAFNVLIHDIKTILNCEAPSTSYCALYELEPSSAVVGTASFSIMSVAAIVFWLFH